MASWGLTCGEDSLINAEYEYIALHRDVGETELKQVGTHLNVEQ